MEKIKELINKIKNTELYKKIDEIRKDKPVQTIKPVANIRIVKVLWGVLIISFLFAVYKNFTAINTHTIIEKETVQFRLNDTNTIENFVKQFAKVFYSWESDNDKLSLREMQLKDYLTTELQEVNHNTIRTDIPSKSKVKDILVWDVVQKNEHEYDVIYEVQQEITENKSTKEVERTYILTVYVDDDDKVVIIKNPTIYSAVSKSAYEPKAKQNDNSLDADMTKSVEEFLETFFKLYPSATEKEISYYVDNKVLIPVNENYLFSSLKNITFTQLKDSNIQVSVYVEFLDKDTKATQISQYDLTLKQNGDNWKIIK